MRHYFTFCGIDSRSFGVYISGSGVYDAPARKGEQIDVPGRSGLLYIDEEAFGNVSLVYPAFIFGQFGANIAGLRNALLSVSGYARLQDTYHPDEYRLARYAAGLEVSPIKTLKAGSFDLEFDCQPQRYLVAGETAVEFTSTSSITNPTSQIARPLIRAYGTGTIMIGSSQIDITQADVYTDIDCDMQEAYKGSASKNEYVTLSGNEFPVIHPGENSIYIGSGITKIELTPRWWRL